jgi:hypothetical protein
LGRLLHHRDATVTTAAPASLTVEPLGDGRYAVPCASSCRGDGAPHVVAIGAEIATCDCPAYVLGHRMCRHISCVRDHLVLAPLVVTAAAGPGLERDVPLPDDQADGSA